MGIRTTFSSLGGSQSRCRTQSSVFRWFSRSSARLCRLTAWERSVAALLHGSGRARVRLWILHTQAAITSLSGVPRSVIRLSTLIATSASRFWASNFLALRPSPMMCL